MGFFTIECVNPECDHRVRRGEKACPECGTGAPRGTITCGSCRKENRSGANYCSECSAKLAVAAKPKFDHGRWARQPGDFAVRIDVDDIKGWLAKPLVVEYGTRALVFQGGQLVGEVEDGKYDLGGIVKRLTGILVDQPASVVLMDAGDLNLDLENGGLWTTDGFELEASHRLVCRVDEPEAMFLNLIKGRGRLTLDDLEQALAAEVHMLLESVVAKYEARQLISSLDAYNAIHEQLRQHLNTSLVRFGLSFVQLRFIHFSGEDYEKLRQGDSELMVAEQRAYQAAQRARLNERLRETLTQDKMHEFKSAKDLEDFIRQTEHELGLKEVIRDDEMQRLTERFHHERHRDDVLRRIEIECIENDHERQQAWKQLLADEQARDERHGGELNRRLAEAKNDAEIKKIKLDLDRLEDEQDRREAEWGIRILGDLKEIEYEENRRKVELEGQTLEQRSKATAEALISIADGPAAERITELEKLRRRENMTPEQILALTAETSPEAAQALAKKYEAEGQLSQDVRTQLEQRLAEQREMSQEYADRMERIMQAGLTQMGQVAATRARPVEPTQTVVTPGGVGAPVVINPQSSQALGSCKQCRAALEPGGDFCPSCGKRQ